MGGGREGRRRERASLILRRDTACDDGKAWWQEYEAVGHLVSAVRKQR